VRIPTDGSENAEATTPRGVVIAQHFESTIHILNVVDLQAARGVLNANGLEKEFIERLESQGQEAVDRVTEETKESGEIEVQTAVERTTSYEGAASGIRGTLGKTRLISS
jgi:nucleotide-binding universal stress UspA family protein